MLFIVISINHDIPTFPQLSPCEYYPFNASGLSYQGSSNQGCFIGRGHNRYISILGQPNTSVFTGCSLVSKMIRLHLPISSTSVAPGIDRSILMDNTTYPSIRVTVNAIKKAIIFRLIYISYLRIWLCGMSIQYIVGEGLIFITSP